MHLWDRENSNVRDNLIKTISIKFFKSLNVTSQFYKIAECYINYTIFHLGRCDILYTELRNWCK